MLRRYYMSRTIVVTNNGDYMSTSIVEAMILSRVLTKTGYTCTHIKEERLDGSIYTIDLQYKEKVIAIIEQYDIEAAFISLNTNAPIVILQYGDMSATCMSIDEIKVFVCECEKVSYFTCK